VIAVLTLLATANHAQGGAVSIDDFSEPNPADFFVVGGGTNPTKSITQTSSGAIGGQRDVLVSVIGQANPTAAVGLIGMDTSYAVDAVQIGTNGLSPTTMQLKYDGVGDVGLGGGEGVDLTGDGSNSEFLFHFLSNDAQPTTGLGMMITLTSPGGKSSTVSATAQNSLSAFDVTIPFSSLSGNANLTQITSITVLFNGGAGMACNVDYEVQSLAAVPHVPEPATSAMFATGAAALGVATWRRRSKRQA